MIPKPFQEDEELRNRYSINIERMPQEAKEIFAYIWLAVSKEGEEICQYDTCGNEVLFKTVKEKIIDSGKLKSLWWIPINSSMNSIGITYNDNDLPLKKADGKHYGLYRSGNKEINVNKEGTFKMMNVNPYLYKIGLTRKVGEKEENFLIVLDHWGRRKITRNRDYFAKRQIGVIT